MQSNIYARLITISQELNSEKINRLESYLEFQRNSLITYNDISNKLNISSEVSKKIMNELVKADMVIMCFKVYCDKEMETNNDIYYTIEDIPNEECDGCEKGCPIFKNIIILYKVVYDKNE